MNNDQINFDDFIDFRSFETRIDKLVNATHKFGDASVKENERIKQSLVELSATLDNYDSKVRSIGIGGKGAGDKLSGYKEEITQIGTAYKGFSDQLKRNEEFTRQNGVIIDQMRQRMAELRDEYSKLDLTQKADLKRKKEIEREITQSTKAYDALIRVTNAATKATRAAERSYDALDKQTKQMRADLKGMTDAFDLNTGAINKNNKAAVELQAQIDKNDKILKRADGTMGVHTRHVGDYGRAMKGLVGDLTGLTSVSAGIMLVFEGIKNGLGIIEEMNRYDAGLKAVSRDSTDLVRSQRFLMAEANRLGLEYGDLVDSYKGLKAATKDTNLEGRNTERIFSAVATAGAKLNLSNETIQGTLTALVQMISKGHIQAEELRGQLGERLPGALKLMSEALGVSETKLNKMMEQGELIATEVMPKFSDSLDKAYGLKQGEKIDNLTASTNRFKNELYQTIQAFGNSSGITSFFKAIYDGFSQSLRAMRLFVKDGSWAEMVTFFGAGSFSNRTAFRMRAEDESGKFSGMDAKARKAELDRLAKLEVEQRKKGETDAANETQAIRRRLRAENLKLEVAELKEGRRKIANEEKDAIEKNEADIARFQKQSVRKRTAEIIALEKQIAADRKKGLDTSALDTKLSLYRRLDTEKRSDEKAVKDRLDSYKPEKNNDSALEKLDKQIKEIEKTIESQALQDLKEGKVIDVDPALLERVVKLKQQYKEIKEYLEFIERGRVTIEAKPIETNIETFFGRTGKRSEVSKGTTALSDEQIKAADAKRLAAQTKALAHQAAIIQEYDGKRSKLLNDFQKDPAYNRFTDGQKGQLLNLLNDQMDAERAGQKERVQLIQDEINRKKELYKEDLANRKAVIDKSIEIGVALVNGLFDIETQKNQNRLSDLEKQKEAELALAGDSASAKAAIEQKYENERRAIMQRQAIQERTQALFNIAVNGAVAFVSALKTGIPLAVATAALTAVQAGLVLAQPLPQYKDGKNIGDTDSYTGPAIAGEAGRELWFHDGNVDLLTKRTRIDVGKNDVIAPNWLTEKILNDDKAVESSDIMRHIAASRQASEQIKNAQDRYQAQIYSQAIRAGASAKAIGKEVAKAMAEKPSWSMSIDKNGFNLHQHDAHYKRTRQRNKQQLGRKKD